MADKVRSNVEESLSTLNYFEEKKFFSIEQIREIVKCREVFEY